PVGSRTAVPLESDAPELEVRDLTVKLGGNTIVDGLGFSARQSEIVCIIGPNGAGKSTFLNALSGLLSTTSGSIVFGGRDITKLGADRRALLGLARTFQVPSLFPDLTVREHLSLARQEGSADAYLPARYRLMEERRGDVLVEKLSLGDRRLLEISMALSMRPQVLLLDEPAAGLARHESELLVKDLKEMRNATGCAVICVEHDMELVRTLADRVVCLHQGRVLSEGTMDQVSGDENVRRSYLGQA
ncbi:ABC transporter ATP-binding protein, partial [Rhizobiaceae sp. 2RAB30]